MNASSNGHEPGGVDLPDDARFDDFDNDHTTPDPEQTIKSSVVPEAPTPPPSSAPTWQRLTAVELYEASMEEISRPQPAYVPMKTGNSTSPAPPPPISHESAARLRARRRRSRRRSSGFEWAWVIVAGAIFSIVLLVGMSGVLLLQNGGRDQEIVPTATLDVAMLPPPVDVREDDGPLDQSDNSVVVLGDGQAVELKPWDGDSRFTILVMGIDRRPGDRSLAHLTDTMILVSIDPQANTIGMLSIPRDLWVQVPGYTEYQRINTPMVLGEIRQPGSGAELAMQTVQYNLGIRVHEYVILDFQTVIDLVNAIGGIEVTTDYTINDTRYPDMYYGYDPFYLPAGTHTLDGETALKFARTRHGDNDLERARRQQQVIYAVRDKVVSFDMLPNLVMQAPSLLASLDDNFYTGLSLQEMIELAWFAKDVPAENISTGVIDYNYVSDYQNARGDQVLIPNRARLGSLMVATFGETYNQ